MPNSRVQSFKLSHKDGYKLVVVGGGCGGLATSSRFVRELGDHNVAVVDPSNWHYYQPGWTLVGGGIKTADQVRRAQKDLIPKGVDWIKTKAQSFDPDNNTVYLDNGNKIKYDYLIVATGIKIDFDGIKNLKEALANDDRVVSIYSHDNVKRVFPAIQKFKGGNAIFTFPKMPIKCPGAPQKIMYMAEDYFELNNVRNKASIIYNTSLPSIYSVKRYEETLMKIVGKRNIVLNTNTNLIDVDYKRSVAIFEKLDKPGTTVEMNYSLLHVTPPMKPFDEIKNSKLVDNTGYVNVDKDTLQHKIYPNVFGIGDCSNIPTSKTAAAVSAQSLILFNNLKCLMEGKELDNKYDGYTSCPIITQYGKIVLAEFGFDGKITETFSKIFDQSKPNRLAYLMKVYLMPEIYWKGLIRGCWSGPAQFRGLFGKS